MAIQWIGLCVAAAMICAMLRPQRPELAMVISLAVGVAALYMLSTKIIEALPQLESLKKLIEQIDAGTLTAILRATGITVIAELGGQLCQDAGEGALAGRIALISRISILALCVPVVGELLELLWQLVS